jgi:hypothetical protein
VSEKKRPDLGPPPKEGLAASGKDVVEKGGPAAGERSSITSSPQKVERPIPSAPGSATGPAGLRPPPEHAQAAPTPPTPPGEPDGKAGQIHGPRQPSPPPPPPGEGKASPGIHGPKQPSPPPPPGNLAAGGGLAAADRVDVGPLGRQAAQSEGLEEEVEAMPRGLRSRTPESALNVPGRGVASSEPEEEEGPIPAAQSSIRGQAGLNIPGGRAAQPVEEEEGTQTMPTGDEAGRGVRTPQDLAAHQPPRPRPPVDPPKPDDDESRLQVGQHAASSPPIGPDGPAPGDPGPLGESTARPAERSQAAPVSRSEVPEDPDGPSGPPRPEV